MAELFVSNTTKQNWEFQYRVPENDKIIPARIKVGETVQLQPYDMNQIQIESVVKQLEMIGALPPTAVSRAKDFVGLCYGVDKRPREDAILTALERNDDVLERRGHEMRKESAVAINETLSREGRGPSELDVTVLEDVKRGESHADALEEKIEVRREGVEPKARGRRKG